MVSTALKSQLLAALRRLLRPVVRELIRFGIPYPAMAQTLAQLYVEVAERDFALPFKRQTDSRLAVLTGIHRKEIAALRDGGDSEPEVRVEDTPVTHVIGRWMAGPPYATPEGVALPLLYESVDERVPTFVELVRSLGIDVPARSVADEMVRLGALEMRPHGAVVLRQQAYIPASGLEGKIALLGSEPAELFATIAANIEHPEAPRLQRKVIYDNVGAEALEEIRRRTAELGEEFLRRANALLASYDRDREPDAPGGARARVSLGIYHFQETEAEESPEPRRDAAGRPARRPRRRG